MSLAETIKQTLRSDLQSEDVSRGVVDRDTPGAFPETPAFEDRDSLGEPAGGLGGATADPTGARGNNMQKGLVPEVPFREGSDEANQAQAPGMDMTDSGVGLPNGSAETPLAPQDEQPVERETPGDAERPMTPPATVRPTSPALAAMRASNPDVSQTLPQDTQTTLPIRERQPLDATAADTEVPLTETQRPHRRSLSQGAGTYNSVIGHGSGEEPTASHRLVPHTGDDEVAMQAMTAAASVPQGSGVYNGVIGHGSNIDDASEARRSLSRHSGDAESSRRRGSRPGSHGSSTLEDVPETVAAGAGGGGGGGGGGVAAHTLSSQQRGGDASVAPPNKPETGAFDLYQPSSAAPHDRHARDMSLEEQSANPSAHSVGTSEHSIPNDTHFRNTSTTIKESPDALVDDADRSRLGSEGGMTAAGAAAGLAGGAAAATSTPQQREPQTMEEMFRPLSNDETSSLSSTLSASQQHQQQAAAGGLRKPGQSIHSPKSSVDAMTSSPHFRSTSGASSLYSQQQQPREYRPLDSNADAHYKERGPAVPSAADAGPGQGPYRTLGSGTPSGVQI